MNDTTDDTAGPGVGDGRATAAGSPPSGALGRDAEGPREIPARGWKQVLRRVWKEKSNDHLGLVSAGVAFYLFLSLFPATAALVSIYGLFSDPNQVAEQIDALSGALPAEARSILSEQMRAVASTQSSSLGWGVLAGILAALWGASKSMKALMTALNIAYEEHENRGFLVRNATALSMTLAAIVALLVAVGAIAVVPLALDALGIGGIAGAIVGALRWPLLLALFVALLSVLYRRSPDRERAEWRWVTPGSAVAATLWLLLSVAFSVYVEQSGKYNETYGSLGAVVVLLMWLYLSAYVVLLGGEVNSELELQTRRDTTTGPDRPRGERGAYVADHVADGQRRQDRRDAGESLRGERPAERTAEEDGPPRAR